MERPTNRWAYAKQYAPLYNMKSPISFGSKVIAKVKFFSKVGQKSRSQSQKLWYRQKGLVTRNTHVKYESLSLCFKVSETKPVGPSDMTDENASDRRKIFHIPDRMSVMFSQTTS